MILASCTQAKLPSKSQDSVAVILNGDTIGVNRQTSDALIVIHAKYDSLLSRQRAADSALALLQPKYDSLLRAKQDADYFNTKIVRTRDSLRTALFRDEYKIIKVKYYVSLCMKHPVNDKYLKGWINAIF